MRFPGTLVTGTLNGALVGNTLYNGTLGDYSHFFNRFFVVGDPFRVLLLRLDNSKVMDYFEFIAASTASFNVSIDRPDSREASS